MKNTDVFSPMFGYDMIVSITEKTINDQLKHLANPDIGVIKTSIIMGLVRSEDKKSHVAKFYDSWDLVPKDSDGVPTVSVIRGNYLPSISITESGTIVALILTFSSGSAYFPDVIDGGFDTYDMTGWKYGIAINLNFAGISADAIKAGKAVPPVVVDRLTQFTSDDFSVSQLFVDFTDVNLMRFDPEITSVGNAGDDALNAFTQFMTNFLHALQVDPTANPYILGYTITKTPATVDPDKDVPPSLKPIGQTFTLFKDPTTSDRSNVNFILNTQGGQGHNTAGIHPTPGIFDNNALAPGESCDGIMIYSSFCFLDTLLLEPFYNSFAQSSANIMKNAGLNIPAIPTYASAVSATPTGKKISIAEVTSGDDQYTNEYTVDIKNEATGFVLNFTGKLYARKEVSKDMGLCTAHAWSTGFVDWTSSMTISLTKDASGKPTLDVTPPVPKITQSGSNSDKDTCAKAWSTIGQILGAILDAFTLGLDMGFFSNLFSDLLSPHVANVPNPVTALRNINSTVNGSFMLPAGQVFFFKNVASDLAGNTSIELTYKTDTFGFTPPPAAPQAKEGATTASVAKVAAASAHDSKVTFSSNPHSRVAIPNKVLLTAVAPSPALTTVKSTEPPPQVNPLAQPLTDKVTVPSLADKGKNVDITISCELMTNTSTAMPISSTAQLAAVQDSTGQPLLFAIGSDKKFHALTSSSGSNGSGYTVVDILDDFPNYSSAVAFAVSQDTSGLISLAMALADQKGDHMDVFFVDRLSPDLSKTDLAKLSAKSFKIGGLAPDFVVSNLALGTSDDGRRALALISGRAGTVRSFYQLQASDTSAAPMSFPENLNPDQHTLMNLEMGYNFGQRANYFLYEIGQTKSLVAISIADANSGSLVYDYSPGNQNLPAGMQHLSYNNIATSTARSGPDFASSDLYITTDTGVYRIPHGKANAMELVSDAVKDAHELVITSTEQSVSLWVAASPNFLYYIYGKKTADSTVITWNGAIKFATGVLHIAAIKKTNSNANEIFTVNSDLSITHYWQDPTTTNWNQKTAVIKDSGFVINQNSYVCQYHFESGGIPLADTKVNISSSEWQYSSINGLTYSLDHDVQAEVETDFQGNINLVLSAIDVSPPIIHIQSSSFAETLNIYPNGKIQHHLQDITDGPSLQNAKTQDGKPVLDSSITPDVASGVATQIVKINNVTSVPFPPTAQGNIFTAVEKPKLVAGKLSAVKHSQSAAVDLSHIPLGFVTGMVVRNGAWTVHSAASAASHVASLKANSILEDLSDFAGDVFHWLSNFVSETISFIKDGAVFLVDGVSFVINKLEDGLEFILNIADKALRLVLKTVGMIFKALDYVLKLIGIDLDKILAWIGHLLGWDHIWATHQMIAGLTKIFLDFAAKEGTQYIESLRAEAKNFFAGAEKQVRDAILPENAKSSSLITDSQSNGGNILNTPQGSYSTNIIKQLPSNSSSTAPAAPAPAASDPSDPITQFARDVIEPTFEKLAQALGKDADDFLKLVTDMSLDNLRILVADAIDGLIEVLATVFDGILKFAEDIIADIVQGIDEPLDIPIIGALWDFITELFGNEEPLTALNAISLLLAIPATTVMKITAGTTPDQMDTAGDLINPNLPSRVISLVHQLQNPESVPQTKTASKLAIHTLAAKKSFEAPEWVKILSQIGGVIGPIAGCTATVCDGLNWKRMNMNGRPQADAFLTKLGLGGAIVKMIFTIPLPGDDQNTATYILRCLAWVVGSLTQCGEQLLGSAPKKAKAIVNIVLLIMAIIIDGVEGSPWASWVSDISGSLGSGVAEFFDTDPRVVIAGYCVSIVGGDLIALVNNGLSIHADRVNKMINVGGV